MTAADWVTTVLSVTALLVSLTTLYLTYLRKDLKLVGVLAEYWVDEPNVLMGVVLDFALSNTGNKDLLVRKAAVELVPETGGLLPEIECKELPAVVKPDHVTLIKIELPQRFMRNAVNANGNARITFEVFGPGAAQYRLSKVLPFRGGELVFTESAWEPFHLEKVTA